MKTFVKDKLQVEIFENRTLMGEAAAKDISAKIKELLSKKQGINMIFAAAPSQNDVLKALVEDETIEWDRVNAYHMDEYIGLDKNAPQGFGNFLKAHIFGLVPFKSVNYIDITATDPEKEAERYGKLLKPNPTDIVVMGIGENGHIAFNEPGTPFGSVTHIVDLTESTIKDNSRLFKSIDEVPRQAFTMGLKNIMNAKKILILANGANKAKAVYGLVKGEVTENVPASILQLHPDCTLVCDEAAAELIG